MINRMYISILAGALCAVAAHAATVQLPQTGQAASYRAGDDGALNMGGAWPSPRFTDNGNGTVTDNLTTLVWLKKANCTTLGTKAWNSAIDAVNALSSGQCELTDNSVAGQWRLPNLKELMSLTNRGEADSAAWLNGQGFTGVQSYYWSSTTYIGDTSLAWYVNMGSSLLYNNINMSSGSNSLNVLPVRSGQ